MKLNYFKITDIRPTPSSFPITVYDVSNWISPFKDSSARCRCVGVEANTRLTDITYTESPQHRSRRTVPLAVTPYRCDMSDVSA